MLAGWLAPTSPVLYNAIVCVRPCYGHGSQSDSKSGKVKVTISRGVCHLNNIGSGSLVPVAGQGLAGRISGISVSCTAHVKAKLSIWPHPSCSFDVDGSVGSGSASILVGVGSNAGRPVLSAKSVDVSVKGFKIKFHGSEPLTMPPPPVPCDCVVLGPRRYPC